MSARRVRHMEIGKSYSMVIRGGKEGGGKGALIQVEQIGTLPTNTTGLYIFQYVGNHGQ